MFDILHVFRPRWRRPLEFLAVIFGLGLCALVFVVPIVALVLAVRARREVRLIQTEMTGARFQLERAEKQLAKLARQMSQRQASQSEKPQATTRTSEATSGNTVLQSQTPPEPNRQKAELPAEVAAASVPIEEQPAPEPEAEVNVPPPGGFDWEGLIGVRLFAWLGGGALFLGAALFLHYSIQQNLISPPVRVALGLIAGALLLAGGDRIRVKTNLAGQAMAGAGIGTLYASLYAARTLYYIVPAAAAFASMILVTVTAGILSVRRGAYLIALLGLVGGMATPFMLSTGEDHPWSLFAYIALLDAGVVLVVKYRNWPTLALIGMFVSLLVFIGWSSQYLYANRTPYALTAVAVISGVFATLLWLRRPVGINKTSDIHSAIGQVAVATPLLMAFVFTRLPTLHVEPWFLVTYLTIFAVGAWLTAHRLQSSYLPPVAATLCVLALLSRCGSDVFPARSWQTLACFAVLPIAHLWGWLYSRGAAAHKSLRLSLIVCLSAPLLIGPAAIGIQAPNQPVLPIAIYTGLHVVGLILLAVVDIGFCAGSSGTCLAAEENPALGTCIGSRTTGRRRTDSTASQPVIVGIPTANRSAYPKHIPVYVWRERHVIFDGYALAAARTQRRAPPYAYPIELVSNCCCSYS